MSCMFGVHVMLLVFFWKRQHLSNTVSTAPWNTYPVSVGKSEYDSLESLPKNNGFCLWVISSRSPWETVTGHPQKSYPSNTYANLRRYLHGCLGTDIDPWPMICICWFQQSGPKVTSYIEGYKPCNCKYAYNPSYPCISIYIFGHL